MKKICLFVGILFFMGACSTTQKVVQTSSSVDATSQQVSSKKTLKRTVAIARFSNETQYAKGLFYKKENDPIVNQAVDILSTQLTQSGKFILLERNDIKLLKDEQILSDSTLKTVGADYLIIGSVTQYGRKNIGDQNLFSHEKKQMVEASVVLRLVDVKTGQIIYSDTGKGEAEANSKTIFGFGENAGYDATLNDKAIEAALSNLVQNVITNCMDRPWRAYFLSYDMDAIIISGGTAQGIEVGSEFDVYQRGKKVKNPQTGLYIELPGKLVGRVQVAVVGGDIPENQYSVVSFLEGDVDKENLNNYYLQETK